MSRLAAFRAFENELQNIANAADGQLDRRDVKIAALQSVGYLLAALGHDEWAEMFADFALKMSDLDCGVIDEELAPNPDVERRPKSSAIAMCQAIVAVGVDKLAEAGLSRSEIQNRVNEYSDLRPLARPGKQLGKSALSWRDEHRKGREKNPFGQRIWNQMQENVARANKPPMQCAEACFRTAADEFRRYGAFG